MHRVVAAAVMGLWACNAAFGVDELRPADTLANSGGSGDAAATNGSGGSAGGATSGANGQPCVADGECDSGHCPEQDGVCCDTSCDLECEACLASKTGVADGTCSLVDPAIAPDPDGECDDRGVSSCGSDGSGCSGTATSCKQYPDGVSCMAASCDNATAMPERQCNGVGQCVSSEPVSCTPYICDTTACRTSCNSNAHCVGTHYCTNGNNCARKKTTGEACSSNGQCQSGVCYSGNCT